MDAGARRTVAVTAAGLLCAILSVPTSTAETGGSGETVYYGERCFDWDEDRDGSCPASSEADDYLAAYQDPSDCPIIEVEEGSRYSGSACCYDVVMEACYEPGASGCLDKF
jgi:hypothetical protein